MLETTDGKPFTKELSDVASIVYFETPKGNIVIFNDAVFNMQNMIIKKKDFERILKIHSVGGSPVEIKYVDGLVSQEFQDEAKDFKYYPEFEEIKDLHDPKYVGCIVFKDKDVASPFALLRFNEKNIVMHTRSLVAESLEDTDDKYYRIHVGIGDPFAEEKDGMVVIDHHAAIKVISIDVGNVVEEVTEDGEEKA